MFSVRHNYNVILNHLSIITRCIIDECNDTNYNEAWVKDVIPGEISKSSGFFVPEHCTRYKFVNESIPIAENGTCLAHWFEHDKVQCNKFIFEENERTIVNDVR